MTEEERLLEIMRAIAINHATVWSSSACGTGRPGGQAITSTYHHDAVFTLSHGALQGHTLKQIADTYEQMYPKSRRLDNFKPKTPMRAGPDGRPL